MATRSDGPELDLDWEEGLFRIVRRLVRALRRRGEPESKPGEVQLESLATRLAALASLLAGRPLRVLPAREQGGVRGDDLLLPASLSVSPNPEDNVLLYLVRTIVSAELAADHAGEVSSDPIVVIRSALERLRAGFAGFEAAWQRARDVESVPLEQSCLWGPILARPIDPATETEAGELAQGVDSDATEIEAPPIEEITLHRMAEEPLDMPVHSFEKVEMAEAFGGTFRRPDGSDELDSHLEALEEVDLGHMLRGGPSAGSLMKAELSLGADVPDVAHIGPDEGYLSYDEWSTKKKAYRPDWCRVYPTPMPPGDGGWAREALARHRKTIERLHAQLFRHRDRLRERPRALDGEDVDIDALCQSWATLKAGHTPSPRLYVEQARMRRDLATTVLLDISLSTDSWVANRRVLDVARESVLVLGEVADRLGDELQVLAFASHTRHKIRCWTVRDWSEPWSVGRARLGQLEPQGYTRIGPALRHATAELVATRARHKLLLLVSDCKPTDYDRCEGRHGMTDVHKALGEAGRVDVHVHALAIDAVATSWLAGMFGAGQWAVLPRPDRLPEALTQAYGRSV